MDHIIRNNEGFLLSNVFKSCNHASTPVGGSPLIPLVESLHCLWDLVSSISSENPLIRVKVNVRTALKALQAPVASLITSLSLSLTLIRLRDEKLGGYNSEKAEYLDSNESESSLKHDPSNLTMHGYNTRHQRLEMASVAVQCVALLLNSVDEREALVRYESIIVPSSRCPLLPNTAARALGALADIVLVNSSSRGKWSEEYPFEFQSSGAQLDAFLCMVYRLLYGITLIPQTNLTVMTKDIVFPTFNSLSIAIPETLPESMAEAAQLYRCIVRVYCTGRRHPPKAALDCILKSLPLAEESDTAKAVKMLIWKKSNGDTYTLNDCETDILAILDEKCFTDIQLDFLLKDDLNSQECTEYIDEEEIVRRGVINLQAKGPIPRQSTDSKSRNDTYNEREETFQTETALSQKAMALIDAICIAPHNYERWFHLGLCLSIKAELVNDRLPPLLPHDKGYNFHVSSNSKLIVTANDSTETSSGDHYLPLRELLKAQFDEFQAQRGSRLETVGVDLSFYVRSAWADFRTLERSTQSMKVTEGEYFIFQSIRALYDQGKFHEWQNCWGRLFVSSLHLMSKRCHQVALALYSKKRSVDIDEDIPLNEDIAEALGTAYYNDLMGSTSYGYPSVQLSPFEKRLLAKRAIACFQQVIDYGLIRNDTHRWDLHFMIGKVGVFT
jgi:hypothetical protein